MVQEFPLQGPSLNTVTAGITVAHAAVAALQAGATVRIDMTQAERMTPSFANALVMTILDAVGSATFNARVCPVFSTPAVQEAWNKAVERYNRGLRLSNQQSGAA